jgi:hypothetical protein
MQSRNQYAASLCEFAERLRETAEMLFSQVNERTTPAQFSHAQQILLYRKLELEAELRARGRFHYASASGNLHRCVGQVYEDASTRLRLLFQLQQPPAPAPSAPDQQPPITPDAVVNNLRTLANERKRPRDTFLGTDEPPPHPGSTT